MNSRNFATKVAKLLSFGNEIKKNVFCFAFLSLIRNIASIVAKLLHLGIKKKQFLLFCALLTLALPKLLSFGNENKTFFILHFAHLIVTLPP